MVSTDLGVWIAAAFVLMVWTFLVKENPLYRFAEHTFVATSVAHTIVVSVRSLNNGLITPLMEGNTILIIPFILGVLIMARVYRPVAWIARYPLAILIAMGMALGAAGIVRTQITTAIERTIQLAIPADPTPYVIALNAVTIIGTITCVVYFFFFVEHKGVVGGIARIGRIAFMGSLGTQIAWHTLQRQIVTTGRLMHLLIDLSELEALKPLFYY
jgi:hypothetical protein